MIATGTAARKSRIAHLAGPNATIQNTPPLVTSNKARVLHGLPLLADIEGKPQRFDELRAQKLAAPVTVFIEQFSAHPLEADAAELYGPPDGYLDAEGRFHEVRQSPQDKPVFRVTLDPSDGVYPLPYMDRQADGRAWEDDGVETRSTRALSRQPFLPDGSRTFEEVDRLGVDEKGRGNVIGNIADVDFYRLAPSAGYTKGLPEAKRTDAGAGDIAPETHGRDYFAYRPVHLSGSPPRMSLARITNLAQRILGGGAYDGAIWTQGSPRIEETIYWFNLLLDVTVPVCGNASQRYHGMISNDGPKNLADSTEFIHSRIWADEAGRSRTGCVMVQDQRIFAARDVMKVDARPGGYTATGGHGGILGAAGGGTGCVLRFVPVTKHTYLSEVNITRLPGSVTGLREGHTVAVAIKDEHGALLESAIPKVPLVKDTSYAEDDWDSDPSQDVDILALIDHLSRNFPLSGFVLEGLNPYGKAASASKNRALARAAYMGFPVAQAGRGNTEGFAIPGGPFISASNLTSTKARILLMACIMKLGMLPAAADPLRPTAQEQAATMAALKPFQDIFDTH